jgi:O-antigen ligase
MVGAMVMLIVCGSLAAVYVPRQSLERFSTISSEVEGGHLGGRGAVWLGGLRAFAQRPLLGYGAANFKGAVAPYVGRRIVAHNSYLSVLVEQGIVGFVPWFLMFVAVFRQVRRLPPTERRFGLVLLGALGVALLPLSWEDKKPVWFVLGILAAFAEAMRPGRTGMPIPQPHPLQAVPVPRPGMRPRPRVYPVSPPAAGPTGAPTA